MRNFRVTVNGNTYDVEVEELGEIITSQDIQKVVSTQTQNLQKVSIPSTAKSSAPESAHKINSPMPGNILDIKVKQGDVISENQIVIILEAMKMENEIVSPFAGKVATINVSKGATVNSGDLLLSIIE